MYFNINQLEQETQEIIRVYEEILAVYKQFSDTEEFVMLDGVTNEVQFDRLYYSSSQPYKSLFERLGV